MHGPVEVLVHLRSGTLDDRHSSAHWLGGQIVPFPKVAVELIERYAAFFKNRALQVLIRLSG